MFSSVEKMLKHWLKPHPYEVLSVLTKTRRFLVAFAVFGENATRVLYRFSSLKPSEKKVAKQDLPASRELAKHYSPTASESTWSCWRVLVDSRDQSLVKCGLYLPSPPGT